MPNVEILVPLAALRVPEGGSARSAGEAGKTDTSAPESIKNGRLSLWQKSDSDPSEGTALTEGIVPGEDVVIGPRPARFPGTDVAPGVAEDDPGGDAQGPSYGKSKDPRT